LKQARQGGDKASVEKWEEKLEKAKELEDQQQNKLKAIEKTLETLKLRTQTIAPIPMSSTNSTSSALREN